MDKIKCEELLREYKEIKSKIDEHFRLRPGIDLTKNPPINPPLEEGLEKRKKELAKDLKDNCKKCLTLTDKEVFEIEVDSTAEIDRASEINNY